MYCMHLLVALFPCNRLTLMWCYNIQTVTTDSITVGFGSTVVVGVSIFVVLIVLYDTDSTMMGGTAC